MNKVMEATTKLVALLETLELDDRNKAIQAAFVLLGMTGSAATPALQATPGQSLPSKQLPPGAVTEREFFEAKLPESKGEELAVAAKYRELYADATSSTKDELQDVIKKARRNFDTKNYARDIDNARTKGLFNRGNGTDAVLSHYGQNYVDALPDRDAVKALRRPKGAGAKRVAAKKIAKKTPKKG